ncbi:hypothetical protein BDI4_60110 [Burkholderia diffusa]|nr:hypothetical protein BDI4_60110 [Burkholderia diffusa]
MRHLYLVGAQLGGCGACNGGERELNCFAVLGANYSEITVWMSLDSPD